MKSALLPPLRERILQAASREGRTASRIDPVRLLAAGFGVAAILVWREPPVTLFLLGVTLGVDHLLRRRTPGRIRREREQAAAQLPFAADLLAAALRTGTPVDRAVGLVGGAVGGPLGDRLLRVVLALREAAAPREAWAAVADIPGGARLVDAAVRSADSGAALAGALNRLADDLRFNRASEVEALAQRTATLVVLPLGFCFLPAFLLAGVIPVALSVLPRFMPAVP